MPALKDLFNNSILPYVDDFTSIGYDGTPTYDLTTKAPIKTGNKLCGPVQDENFSVMGDYGGGDSIWKVRFYHDFLNKRNFYILNFLNIV